MTLEYSHLLPTNEGKAVGVLDTVLIGKNSSTSRLLYNQGIIRNG
jgi:hypothetical protein